MRSCEQADLFHAEEHPHKISGRVATGTHGRVTLSPLREVNWCGSEPLVRSSSSVDTIAGVKRSPARIAVVAMALAALAFTSCSPPAPLPSRMPVTATPAIEHLGTSTAVTDRVQPTLRIKRPAAVAAGAVLLAQIATRQPGAAVTPPEGWTEVGLSQGADQLKSWVFVRVAT